jgi:hypothetical protein
LIKFKFYQHKRSDFTKISSPVTLEFDLVFTYSLLIFIFFKKIESVNSDSVVFKFQPVRFQRFSEKKRPVFVTAVISSPTNAWNALVNPKVCISPVSTVRATRAGATPTGRRSGLRREPCFSHRRSSPGVSPLPRAASFVWGTE